LGHNIHPTYKFDDFLTEIAWDVSTGIVNKTSAKGDESVIFRNQMIRFIKNNFYDELKEYWDNK
jgi:hypothetical protein